MASGTGAALDSRAPGPLAGLEWLAVGDAQRRPGQREARIRAAAPLTEDLALEAAGSLWTEVDEVTWTSGRVLARRRTSLGAIELSSTPLSDPPAQAVRDAIREALASEGIALLAWTEAATALRARLDFLHRALGDPWPDVSDAALTQNLDSWLGPQLARVRSAQDLRRIDVTAALRATGAVAGGGQARRPGPRAGRGAQRVERADRLLRGSAGARRATARGLRLDRSTGPGRRQGPAPAAPALARAAAGRRHRRPGVVLGHGYPGVRAELRGRYPKHAWPDDPRSAPATARDEQKPAEAEWRLDPPGVGSPYLQRVCRERRKRRAASGEILAACFVICGGSWALCWCAAASRSRCPLRRVRTTSGGLLTQRRVTTRLAHELERPKDQRVGADRVAMAVGRLRGRGPRTDGDRRGRGFRLGRRRTKRREQP